MANEKNINMKKEQVAELSNKIKESNLVLLVDYRGINVDEVTTLRNELRNTEAEYKVIKNNITKRALEAAGIEGLEEKLEGPTAVIMTSGDYLEPTKVIYNFTKDHDFYSIKAGVMDGKLIDVAEVKKLASLPSKETLYSMLASALLGNIRNLAVVLDQAREKQAENA